MYKLSFPAGYLSPQGFRRSSHVGLRVACGAGRDRLWVTDVWMPGEAWRAGSAMAVLWARSAWRSGLPGGGLVPAIWASAGMMTRLVSRVKNRAVDRPSAVSW